jgi:hypothetical protein
MSRTYHASCLIGKFMIVCGGEAAVLADLQDIWALDIETQTWQQLYFSNTESFHAKRFHTASAVSNYRVITFGGCHSEYVHLNEVSIFDLTNFVLNGDTNINCEKVLFKTDQAVPSSRWGHTASVYQDKIYIYGGRNETDVSDLHVFCPDTKTFTEIPLRQRIPKPRRRASAVFISSTLILFGGFDGEFFNDLHALHTNEQAKLQLSLSNSTID